MKRKITIALFALIVAAFLIVFVGCEQKENPDNDAPLLQFDGATVSEDNKIEISVGKDVKSVKLTDKVKVKNGYTWKLYADKLGTTEISTKIAANVLTSELLDGDNDFYIVVNSDDGKKTIVYELTIFRNHEVTVFYVYNGTTVKTDFVDTNSTYTLSVKGDEDFFDEGFNFNGWQNADGDKVSGSVNVEKDDVVLTADLTGKEVQINFDANGGTLSQTKLNVIYGDKLSLPVPTKIGNSFIGWQIDGQTITDKEGKGESLASYKSVLTATAEWEKITYSLTIDCDHSSGWTTANKQTGNFGDTISVKASAGDGYVFDGWYQDDVLLSKQAEYTFSMPSKDITIAAKFKEREYAVTLNPDGGQCEIAETKVPYKSNFTLPVPTKTGYEFIGWFTDNSGRMFADSNGQRVGLNIISDTALSARYTPIKYSITSSYVLKNFETSIVPEISVSVDDVPYTQGKDVYYGDEITLHAATLNTPELHWKGWYDGDALLTSEKNYSFSMPAKDLHLQARWEAYLITQRVLLDDVCLSEESRYFYDDAPKFVAYCPTTETITDQLIRRNVWVGWFVGEEKVSDNYIFDCEITTSATLEAKFVSLTIEGSDMFSVALSIDDNTLQAKFGKTVTASTEADTDVSSFEGWFDQDGNKLSNELNYTFTLTEEKLTLRPQWKTVFLTIKADGEKVNDVEVNSQPYTVNKSYPSFAGTEISVRFDISKLQNNNLVLGWYVDGEVVATTPNYSFTMPNEPLTLELRVIPCPVTVVSVAPNSISLGDFVRPHYIGETVSLQATDVSGYRFKTWLKNGEPYYDHSVLYFTITPEEVTYTAIYDEIPVALDDFDFAVTDDGYSVTGLHNTSVSQIVIPDIVTDIADNAFAEMNLTITELTLPAQLKRIGAQAFRDTFNLKTVRYNGSLADWCKIEFGQNQSTLYRADKFYVNGELIGTELTIPEGVSKINPYLFYGFKPLTRITLPSTMLEVGEYAFKACVNVGEITLNEGLQKIGNSAFSLCHKTTRITIPSSVTDLNVYAFMGCRRLAEICDKTEGMLSNALLNVEPLRIYSEGNSYVATDENGYVFFDDPTQETCALIAYVGNQTDITLPTLICGKQYSVHKYAFEQCDIVSVTITDGVTEICENAFCACDNLSTVTISGVQSIGKNAFDSCYCLTDFTFSGNPNLGDKIFDYCRILTNIRYDGSTTEWEQLTKSEQWKGYNELETVTCSNGVITLTA